MAISKFIPEVWSARLLEGLKKNLVFGSLCNRAYEGDITQYGDTVHIQSLADITVRPYNAGEDLAEPEQLDGEDRTLTIDHAVYYNFFLSDVDAAQARADLMDAAMANAARRLAEDTESYLLGVIRAGAGTTAEASGTDIYAQIVTMKTALDSKHVPRQGRKLIVPPAVESSLLLDNRFVVGTNAADARLAEGAVARAAGFDIYISADLDGEMIAMTEDAVTFASQVVRTEAYRREKGFDDGVKGLHVCGARVIQPDCLYRMTLTEA